MIRNYYSILGISSNASPDEVKQAFRSKAKLYHPDVNRSENAQEIFQLINEAYEVLIDEQKKFLFDLKLKYGSSSVKLTPQAKYADKKYKRTKYDFHYDWESFHRIRRKSKWDLFIEQYPYLYTALFVLGFFVGFVILLVTFGAVFLGYWNPAFLIIAIPGFILVRDAIYGLYGETNYLTRLQNFLKRNKLKS